MKLFFAKLGAALAAILGIVFFFMRKSPPKEDNNPKLNQLEKQSVKVKEEIKELDKKLEDNKKPEPAKTLDDELNYWKKDNK